MTKPSDRVTCQWVSGRSTNRGGGRGWAFTQKFDSTFYDLNSSGGFRVD